MTKENQSKRRTTDISKEHMMEVADTLKVTSSQDVVYHPDCTVSQNVERINERELKSVYALLAYVAYNQNVRQETVQMIVEAEFNVHHVSKIRRQDYMRAIEFLVDMRMDEIMN